VPVIAHGVVPWNTVEVVGKFVIAKLVLLIVTVLLTNTVDVKLLTATVPVIAGKLLTATVPVIEGRLAMFTVDVKLLDTTVPVIVQGLVPWNTVEVVGKFVIAKLVLLIVTVLLTNTVDVKLSTVTLPVTPTLHVPLCTAYNTPFTYCIAGQFVTVVFVIQGIVP
jgi:hypothetical protein